MEVYLVTLLLSTIGTQTRPFLFNASELPPRQEYLLVSETRVFPFRVYSSGRPRLFQENATRNKTIWFNQGESLFHLKLT